MHNLLFVNRTEGENATMKTSIFRILHQSVAIAFRLRLLRIVLVLTLYTCVFCCNPALKLLHENIASFSVSNKCDTISHVGIHSTYIHVKKEKKRKMA